MSYSLRSWSPGIVRSQSPKNRPLKISTLEEKNLVRELSNPRIYSGELHQPRRDAAPAIQRAAERPPRNPPPDFFRWPALVAETAGDRNSIPQESRQSGHGIFR